MRKLSQRRLVPNCLRYEFIEAPPAKVWDKIMRIVAVHQQSPSHQVEIESCQRWNGREIAHFDGESNGYQDNIRYCELHQQVTVTSIVIRQSNASPGGQA